MAEAETSNSRSAPRPRSIGYYLIAFALVAVVPSFLFAGVLIQRNQSAQEDTVQTLIVATSRSIVQAMEREIEANVTTLRVLAASPFLHEGDFRSFYNSARLALEDTEANLFVVNDDMSTFGFTGRPFDNPPSMVSDIDAAQRAFDSQSVVVTDLVFGAVSKLWVYNILLPVDLGLSGKKLIALNQRANNFASALSSNSLPDGWNSALLDNEGKILSASPGVGNVGDLFTPFNAMVQVFSVGWQRIHTSSGEAMGVIQRSGLTGWRLVAWAPVSTISQPLLVALLSLIAGGIILLGLIVGGLFWVSRLIGDSVRGLARDARRLGLGEAVVARDYPVAEIAEVSQALELASEQRLTSEQEVRFLMREVAHRSKNQMTVIAAMARQTARGATDVPSYVASFERRVMGLASSTDLLLAHGRAGVSLGDLLESQIAPFAPPDSDRVELAGPEIRLNVQAAQILGMAAHELATNAAKYGAFAGDDGRLVMNWQMQGDRLDFTWRETVSHAMPDSDRVGFGTTVLKTMVGKSLGADVERLCHEDGIEWRFAIPLAAIDPDHVAPGPVEDAASE